MFLHSRADQMGFSLKMDQRALLKISMEFPKPAGQALNNKIAVFFECGRVVQRDSWMGC